MGDGVGVLVGVKVNVAVLVDVGELVGVSVAVGADVDVFVGSGVEVHVGVKEGVPVSAIVSCASSAFGEAASMAPLNVMTVKPSAKTRRKRVSGRCARTVFLELPNKLDNAIKHEHRRTKPTIHDYDGASNSQRVPLYRSTCRS